MNFNPILGFNLDAFRNRGEIYTIGTSSGLGQVEMEYDLEENPIAHADGKKRPRVVLLDSCNFGFEDSFVAKDKQCNAYSNQLSAASKRQAN